MEDLVLDHNFFIEDMDDEMDPINRHCGEDDGSDSDHSSHSNGQTSMPDSSITSWPQSYRYRFHYILVTSLIPFIYIFESFSLIEFIIPCRQSIDLYASVQSPKITLLETQSLTRRNNSFLNSSSFILRHPSSTYIERPLLKDPEDEELFQEEETRWKKDAHIQSNSLEKDGSDDIEPTPGRSSFRHAVVNGR